MSTQHVNFKRIRHENTTEYFLNDIPVTEEAYLSAYHRASSFDSMCTTGAMRRRVRTYTHTCVGRDVPSHLVPVKPETENAE